MEERKKFYLKDVCDLTKLEYNDAVKAINNIDINFKVRGGKQTEIEFNVFKAVCQQYNVEVLDSGHIRIHTHTDGGKINFTPDIIARPPVKKITYNDRALNEFNVMKADKIDPLKIRALLNQFPDNIEVAFKVIETLPKEKTILNDRLVHDFEYLKALFGKYEFVVFPVNLGRRIRAQISPLFTKMYGTDTFNNKIIAFNKDTCLYAFIINV